MVAVAGRESVIGKLRGVQFDDKKSSPDFLSIMADFTILLLS